MKLRRFYVENVRSFLTPAELQLDGDIGIVVGPNGGGKTNLLDTVTATVREFLLRPFTLPIEGNPPRPTLRRSNDFAPDAFERHSRGSSHPQRVTIEVEVTAQDIAGIQQLKASSDALDALVEQREYRNFPRAPLGGLDPTSICIGDRYRYEIVNRSMPSSSGPAADMFRHYLQNLEALNFVKSELDKTPISLPFVYFPVNRTLNDIPSSLAISSFNEADAKQSVDANWSRQVSSIQYLALGRIFRQHRLSIEPVGSQFYLALDGDGSLTRLGETLNSLGYQWEVKVINPQNNEYEFILKKGGTTFNIARASSGEKELLTYALAVYGLNLRDALIVVDEPELHLHPRWQSALVDLFERLARDTNNQFLMATHSPSFISPATIPYVSRVFTEANESRIFKLSTAALPNQKHILSIVNSQNNEKIFFSDMVILVEGLSDRIFFERAIARVRGNSPTGKLIEVVAVGGKTQFEQYASLLTACGVKHRRIADLDYVTDLNPDLGSLFKVDAKGVKGAILDAGVSLDGKAIVSALDESIATASTEPLKPVWEYVRGRRQKLRADLTRDETARLDEYIEERRGSGTFILKLGKLEDYLPDGFSSKDIDRLIDFLSQQDFWHRLPAAAREELDTIIALALA